MPDDSLEILGRIDTQIKLRGVRIEAEGISSVFQDAAAVFPDFATKGLPDVSTMLAQHPSLKTDQLVTFIACDFGVPVSRRRIEKPRIYLDTPEGLMESLEETCIRELASYMRPAHIIPLDFLPLNSNGKTDNRILSALFQDESLDMLGKSRTRYQSANSASGRPKSRWGLSKEESQIADAVARLTAVSRVDLTPFSDLFELGFDSTKLVRLASDLKRVFPNARKSVTASNLVQNPTIEKIAAVMTSGESAKTDGYNESYVALISQKWKAKVEKAYGLEKVEKVLPTFPVQEGVLYRSADLEFLYVQHVVMNLNDGIDIERLKNAWKAVMDAHEILR